MHMVKGEGKKDLDLSYDILKQIETRVYLLKDFLECLIKKVNVCNLKSNKLM